MPNDANFKIYGFCNKLKIHCMELTDEGFIAGNQQGISRKYYWNSEKGFVYGDGTSVTNPPWSINNNKIRLNFEDDINCSKYNKHKQKATCRIHVNSIQEKTINLSWVGMAEQNTTDNEYMELRLDEQKFASSGSAGGGLGCSSMTSVVSKDSTGNLISPSAVLTLSEGLSVIDIILDTKNEFFHTNSYYEFTMDPFTCMCDLEIDQVINTGEKSTGGAENFIIEMLNNKSCCSRVQYRLDCGDWVDYPICAPNTNTTTPAPQLACNGSGVLIPPTTVNGVNITPSGFTGSVGTYPTQWTSCGITIPANAAIVGVDGPFSYTVNFSIAVNNLKLVIVGTGQTTNENFIISTDNGTPTINMVQGCYSNISGNQIFSGAGSPLDYLGDGLSGGGGGIFNILAVNAYTSITISGNGGVAGSLIGICSDSVTSAVTTSCGSNCSSNLILNGDFEQGDPGSSGGGGTATYWTQSQIDVHSLSYSFPNQPLKRWIDLNELSPGYIQQNINTVIGETYTVFFKLAANNFSRTVLRTCRLSVIGSSTSYQDYTFDPSSTTYGTYEGMGWIGETCVFVADSTSTTIKFESTCGNCGAFGPAIDCVEVCQTNAVAVCPSNCANNLISDGNFENFTMTLFASGTFGAWTVQNVDIQDLTPGGHLVNPLDPDNKNLWIDLNSCPNSGWIQQTINTTLGSSYILSFNLGVNPYIAGDSRTMEVVISDESHILRQQFSVSSVGATFLYSNMNWERKTIVFLATSSQTTIRLASTMSSTCSGPAIDCVEVCEQL